MLYITYTYVLKVYQTFYLLKNLQWLKVEKNFYTTTEKFLSPPAQNKIEKFTLKHTLVKRYLIWYLYPPLFSVSLHVKANFGSKTISKIVNT